MAKIQISTKIKIIRTDGGSQFINKNFKYPTVSCGIIHQSSCPYTPQKNGVSERKHHHILEMTRALLHHSFTPHKFWVDAISMAIYFINWLFSWNLNSKIPYQILLNSIPDYSNFHSFGCLCYLFLRHLTSIKLELARRHLFFLVIIQPWKAINI